MYSISSYVCVGGFLLDKTESQGSGIEWMVPVMLCLVVFNWMFTYSTVCDMTWARQYSGTEYDIAKTEVCSVGAVSSHFVPACLQSKLFLALTFALSMLDIH